MSPHLSEIKVEFERVPSRVRLYRITDYRPDVNGADREQRQRYRLPIVSTQAKNTGKNSGKNTGKNTGQ